MKKRSSKKDGFTLLEVVISMMLITILSVGVYNAYIMIIRNTKDGEVKQEAALVGKRIVEEIKAQDGNISTDKDNMTLNIAGQNISLVKNGEDYQMRSDITIDRYDYAINIQPKKTEKTEGSNSTEIFINDKDYTGDVLTVGENSVSDSSNIDSEITGYKVVLLTIKNENRAKITVGNGSEEEINVVDNKIILDFKNYKETANVTLEVTNETTKPLNLYILNSKYNISNERNVTVENKKGSLNEYYRTDYEGKSGILYNITVTVSGKDSRGQKVYNLFQSSFVQNIDTN
jgi:prepilin-type N-terminal cleavage/methylation domain-containing protein